MRAPPLFSLTALLSCSPLAGETFVGPSTQENRLLIGTNEAVMVQNVEGNDFGVSLQISTNVFSLRMFRGTAPYCFSGPGELLLKTNMLLNFQRLGNVRVHMVFNDPTNATTVSVPSGKKIQILYGSGLYAVPNQYTQPVKVTGPSGTYYGNLRLGSIFEGPLEIEFPDESHAVNLLATYWIVDDIFANPNLLVPPGAPALFLEKSGDMANWTTVGVTSQSIGSNSFYRLRVTK